MLVYSPLDLNKNELRNPQVHNLAAAPGTPVKGQLYMNTGDNTLYFYDGTAWVSTRGAGTPPDATTSSKGLIQLAGDLGGTAASPQIAAGVITDAEVAAANKDGAVGVASMRTLGTGAQQALAGTTRLDQLAAPTGVLNMNSQRIGQMAYPTSAGDAATKQYADDVASGLDAKQSVRAASTANIVLGATTTSIDGVTLADHDRVLLKNQTNPAENGIYFTTLGPPMIIAANQRSADADAWTELPSAVVWVEEGTQQDTGWVCTSDRNGTLGTTAVTWAQFAQAGGSIAGPPSGPAGGDLTGTYPNPTITTGAVTSAKIADGTITDTDVAAANKDGAVGVASLRTLGYTAVKAMPGNATLDLINPPVSDVLMNNQFLTGLKMPVGNTDAASKGYVDSVAQGLDAKASVKCATLTNITLSGTQTVDGQPVVVGDRVLVKNQTTSSQNGIYLVASGAWTRPFDADTAAELNGAYTFVEAGTQQNTGWVCSFPAGNVLGVDPPTWFQFSGAGQIIAGLALSKTGNTLDVNTDGTTITVVSDILQIAPGAMQSLGVAGRYSTAVHAAGTTISIPQSQHGLANYRAVIVQCRLESTGQEILTDTTVAANGDVTVTFAVSQAANSIRVIIVG
jgi:Repeat of unknown function (DUF5907)